MHIGLNFMWKRGGNGGCITDLKPGQRHQQSLTFYCIHTHTRDGTAAQASLTGKQGHARF